MNVSIKLKIMAGLLVPIILVFSAIFAITAYDIHDQSRSMAIDSIGKELSHVDKTVSLFMAEAKKNTEMVALDQRTRRADEIITHFMVEHVVPTKDAVPGDSVGQEVQAFYKLILASHPAYVDCYIGTRKGAFIAGRPELLPANYDPRKRPWYSEAVNSRNETTLSKAYVSATGDTMVSTARAIVHGGTVLGVAAMDISLGQLTEQISSMRLGQNGHVMLIQDDGVIIANPEDEKTAFKNVKDVAEPAYRQLFALSSGVVDTAIGGTDRLGVVYTSPELGWKFVGVIGKAEIMEPVYSAMLSLGAVFTVSLLTICAFIWFFMDSFIVRPLKKVVDMLGLIRDGQYETHIDNTRKDEIGHIFDALNDMSGTLADNMQEITAKTQDAEEKAHAAELATQEAREAEKRAERAKAEGMMLAGQQLEVVVREINGITELISAQALGIAEGTNLQRERLQTTATAMEEMNATVLEVARNAGDAAGQGQEAKGKAMNGADVVNQSVEAINSIQGQAGQLRNNMDELEVQARGIGNIMSVITDIADQTNLLALNAAIEAARAGDAGRGFAVVADEVRKLAEKTMTATKEVGDSIEAIQVAADRNVQAMEQAVSDLSTATELSNTSGTVLQEIVRGVELSADRIQGIATAAEQQSAASEEINQSIEEINSIAVETEQAAKETNEALNRLASQAEKLSGMVDSFRNS